MDEKRVKQYFERIGLAMPEHFIPDGENLKKLHKIHTMIIPYENTDYLTGNILSSHPEIQFGEIIERRRGGMCLDVNTLFAKFLCELGYQVRMGESKICNKPEGSLNRHFVFEAVDCDGGCWWCDAANPFITFPEPVRKDVGNARFRYETGPDGKAGIWAKRNNIWEKQSELVEWNISVSDTDESKFRDPERYPEEAVFTKEVFSLVTPYGRKSLTGSLYRESIEDRLIQYECGDEMMRWAYAQFGLDVRKNESEIYKGGKDA